MSALDDIEAAAGALNNLTAAELAQKSAIDASVAAALAAIVVPARNVYLDAAAGSDGNDGTSPARAVASLAKALSFASAGQFLTVVMMSDVQITGFLAFGGDVGIVSDSIAIPGVYSPTALKRRLIVQQSALQTAGANQFALLQTVGSVLRFYGVEVHLSGLAGGQGVIAPQRDLGIVGSAITWDAPQSTPLIALPPIGSINFQSSTLPSDYPGKIFAGVAAGGDVNSVSPLLHSNLTSA